MGVMLLGAPGAARRPADRRGLPDRQHPPPVDRVLQHRRRRPGQGLHRAAAPLPRRRPSSSASWSWSRRRQPARTRTGPSATASRSSSRSRSPTWATPPAAPSLTVESQGLLAMSPVSGRRRTLAPGQSTAVTLTGRVQRRRGLRPALHRRRAHARGQGPLARPSSRRRCGPACPSRSRASTAGRAAGWRVNPDGADTGTPGRWAQGAPQRSVAFDYTLQPGAAFSGSAAFVTGLSGRRTTRQRRRQDDARVGGLRHQGAARAAPLVPGLFRRHRLRPGGAGARRPPGPCGCRRRSTAGAWCEVDRMAGMATGWQRRLVRLTDKLGAAVASGSRGALPLRRRGDHHCRRAPWSRRSSTTSASSTKSPGCDAATPITPETPPPARAAAAAARMGSAPLGPGGSCWPSPCSGDAGPGPSVRLGPAWPRAQASGRSWRRTGGRPSGTR